MLDTVWDISAASNWAFDMFITLLKYILVYVASDLLSFVQLGYRYSMQQS